MRLLANVHCRWCGQSRANAIDQTENNQPVKCHGQFPAEIFPLDFNGALAFECGVIAEDGKDAEHLRGSFRFDDVRIAPNS